MELISGHRRDGELCRQRDEHKYHEPTEPATPPGLFPGELWGKPKTLFYARPKIDYCEQNP
jgi:hypothetical protein